MRCSSTGVCSSSLRHIFAGVRHGLAASAVLLACAGPLLVIVTSARALNPAAKPPHTASTAPGTPFTAEQLVALLPASVYFQGRTASLQIRNAGGTSFANGAVVWAALVDSSGYASTVQDKYQFYLVTESPLRFGGATLAPGAYGGGFLHDGFVIMDVGGHTVAQGPTHMETALARPRPLEVVGQSASSVKLILGRRSVILEPLSPAGPAH